MTFDEADDIIADIQERQWQAYCAAEHAKAAEQFGPFVAWCIWPYKVTVPDNPT